MTLPQPASRQPWLFSLRRTILLITLTLACLFETAFADPNNARVVGDPESLRTLLTDVKNVRCESLVCPLSFTPVILTLRAPHAAHIQIKLSKAKLSNPHVDTQQDSIEGTPILLRGRTLSLGDSSEPARPVAATIFRDGSIPILEVVVADSPRRPGKASRGLLVFRAPIEILGRSGLLFNARAQASSSQAFSTRKCGAVADQLTHTTQSQPLGTSEFSGNAQYPVLYLATDYDPQFASRIKCSSASACRSRILSIINQTAVLYERQLGYTLEVARQFGPTNLGRDTMSEIVIDSFQQFNAASRLQYLHTGFNSTSDQVDLFQLFTGREMDQDVIGIAYVGTMCQNNQSRFADAVVQHVSNTLNPITTAHEIGHSLNAQHVPDGIMRANLGSTPPTSFASSSLLTISSYLSQWYPECRQGLSDGVANPTPTPSSGDDSNPFAGKPKTLQLSVSSPSPQTVTITTSVSAITSGCSARIRAAATSQRAPKVSPLVEVPQTELTSSITGTATFRVLPDSRRNVTIYFFADYSCADGQTIEVSRAVRFNPNRIAGLSQKRRSKRSWISSLKASLQ